MPPAPLSIPRLYLHLPQLRVEPVANPIAEDIQREHRDEDGDAGQDRDPPGLLDQPATTIPSLALPFSIVGTFAVMYLCSYSLDNFSMMALTLSVGFVVDDAIVMLENIVRHIEQGEGVLEAALKGSNEIGFTILSMTLSLAAVFIPILFMGGVLGRLLHEFAVTIMSAILVSGFVSLTLTPMMCSRFLRPHQPGGEKHGSLFNLFERLQQGMTNTYGRTLSVVLRHKPATIILERDERLDAVEEILDDVARLRACVAATQSGTRHDAVGSTA